MANPNGPFIFAVNLCLSVLPKICPFAKLGFEGVNICKKPRLFSKNWFRSGRGRRLRRPVIKTDSDHNKYNEDINRIRICNSNRYVFSGRRGRRPLPTYPDFIPLNKNLQIHSVTGSPLTPQGAIFLPNRDRRERREERRRWARYP